MTHNPTTILRMREFGESVLANLSSHDPRISGSVRVSHPDGSSSVVGCAYPQRVGNWLFVFSLIDGFVLFGLDDVTSYRQDSEFSPTAITRRALAQSRSHLAKRDFAANVAA
jgi:hypothetical protein